MSWRALSPLHWANVVWLALAAVAGFLLWRWNASAASHDRALARASLTADLADKHHKRAAAIQAEADDTRQRAERRLHKLRGTGHETLATKIARLNRL